MYGGERAFAVNLVKALFAKYEGASIEENIFISPSSIYHTLMLAYFGALGETQVKSHLRSLMTPSPRWSSPRDLALGV